MGIGTVEGVSTGETSARRRTIRWASEGVVEVIDQTRLPHEFVTVEWRTLDDACLGISTMQVRGAPLIGVAAAHGLALAVRSDPSDLDGAAARLTGTRPTAVNLRWAIDQMLTSLRETAIGDRAAAAATLATRLADDDVASCRRIGETGLALLADLHGRAPDRPVQVLTHCNAGWLACIEHGTATAPVSLAHAAGIPVHVWVSETRPRNQGASLTAWELADAGVPHTLIVDNAAGHLLGAGEADIVIVGADRIAANGDVANKVGTSLKAYAARHHGVPFAVAAPWSTIDPHCPDGAAIPIEERSPDEVLVLGETRLAPTSTPARNWAFDVTPAAFVDHFITDEGLLDLDSLRARTGSPATAPDTASTVRPAARSGR